MTLDQATAAAAIAKSGVNKKASKSKRRRSSAKFLRLSGRFDDDAEEGAAMSSDKLGEVRTRCS